MQIFTYFIQVYLVGFEHFEIWRLSTSLAVSSVQWISLREMAATATAGSHIAIPKPSINASHKTFKSTIANFGSETKGDRWTKLKSTSHISSTWSLYQKLNPTPLKCQRIVTKAMSAASDKEPLPGLPIDLRGWKFTLSKRQFFFLSVIRLFLL